MKLSNGYTIEMGADGDRYVMSEPRPGRVVIGYRSPIRKLRREMLRVMLEQAQERAEVLAALNHVERLTP